VPAPHLPFSSNPLLEKVVRADLLIANRSDTRNYQVLHVLYYSRVSVAFGCLENASGWCWLTEKGSQARVASLPLLGYFQRSQPCTLLPTPFWPQLSGLKKNAS
jgi:hypothetical protein